MYVLDTNACIRYLNGTSHAVRAHLAKRDPREVFLCAPVKAELLYGARRSTRVERNLATLDSFFAVFRSLAFDDAAAEHYGALRVELEATGRTLGGNDLLIAAIARAHDATLVSGDAAFRRVVGLRVTDWEAAD